MSLPQIDNRTARRLFLHASLLSEPPAGPAKGAALADLITRLGFVQVDSVNTLARAHDLILWSRRPTYTPKSLRWLNDRGRATFEHWTHDASIIPMQFFPHWRLKFARDEARLRGRWNSATRAGHLDEIDKVRKHVAQHGAVCSSDMNEEKHEKTTGWWDWHPSKTALEYLWRSGELAITRRQGFRKYYDLTERVAPPEVLNARPSETETIDWACRAALDRLGMATSGELAAFFDLIRPAEAKAWAQSTLARGEIIEAEIACTGGEPRKVFLWPQTVETLKDLPEPPSRLRLLSPFDPALRDRKRAERLFGFHYRIEIFVPEPKRKYGYYVFPLMEGDRLVGRIDVAADRTADRLHVRAIWPERGVKWGKGRQTRLEAELDRLLPLACCSEVTFGDGWLRHPL